MLLLFIVAVAVADWLSNISCTCTFIVLFILLTHKLSFVSGEKSHLSRISFCVNTSVTAPPSPIPTSLPIRVYSKDKG